MLALGAGLVVAAACGLRAFLPLFALGIAARLGVLTLAEPVRWLGDDAALLALGLATILEIASDKIPLVDHALDLVATVLRPFAAAVAAYAVLGSVPEPWAALTALTLGGTALGLHAAKAKTRLGSTAVTGGVGNPVLSVLEDALSLGLVLVAILAPLLAVGTLVMLVWLFRRRRKRLPPQVVAERAR